MMQSPNSQWNDGLHLTFSNKNSKTKQTCIRVNISSEKKGIYDSKEILGEIRSSYRVYLKHDLKPKSHGSIWFIKVVGHPA
jgi:hypothetical protein